LDHLHSIYAAPSHVVRLTSISDEFVLLAFVAFCWIGDRCWRKADVQCNVEAEANSVERGGYCHHFVQENDGLVYHLI